jgi:hypothetical protein
MSVIVGAKGLAAFSLVISDLAPSTLLADGVSSSAGQNFY